MRVKAGVRVNRLYFGDNLDVLREHVGDESVDLVYLDPPFNSKRDYNLLFKSPKGHQSDAQITAFEDSWSWGPQAEREFGELLAQPNTEVTKMMVSLREFLGENDMMAYLTMMANRLLELHRVLKPTGSLYLHCDPTASHYLKVVLDGVFGKTLYRSEINWRRSSAHNDAKQGRRQYGNVRDVIFFYSKSDTWTWNWLYTPYTPEYLESEYHHRTTGGRYFKETDLTANKPGGDVSYEWRVKRAPGQRWEADLTDEFKLPQPSMEYAGVTPYQGRYWAYSRQNLIDFANAGKLQHRATGMPRLIQFADEMPGVPLQNDWQDILPASGAEHLGYDTQKPIALLERIINASSNPGDVVLDPFCGCGTAVYAAQKLARRWIGIDITHLSIALVEQRLKNAFPYLNATSGAPAPTVVPSYMLNFNVLGTPQDLDGARDLATRDKYQFQWWACSLVNARPHKGKKKGADSGIDGLIFFQDDKGPAKKIVVSVKGGASVGVPMVRDLVGVLDREKAAIGLFVTLAEPTGPMVKEAVKAGYYTSPVTGAQFPRLQILTIHDLLAGTGPAYPDLARGGHTFKKAVRDQGAAEQGEIFG